ncbi:hypothetical protein ACLOJK_034878 [Asimina triloba]
MPDVEGRLTQHIQPAIEFYYCLEVVEFCRRYLTVNSEAFGSNKLHLVINDAKAELEGRKEKFDLIVGDLADPVQGGPCYQLYTKSFYEGVLKPKLSSNGIFVTQASDQPFDLDAKQINGRIEERVNGELLYLNGESLISSTIMNKSVYQSLMKETHVYTEEDARFIHGHGMANHA